MCAGILYYPRTELVWKRGVGKCAIFQHLTCLQTKAHIDVHQTIALPTQYTESLPLSWFIDKLIVIYSDPSTQLCMSVSA